MRIHRDLFFFGSKHRLRASRDPAALSSHGRLLATHSHLRRLLQEYVCPAGTLQVSGDRQLVEVARTSRKLRDQLEAAVCPDRSLPTEVIAERLTEIASSIEAKP